MYATLRPYPSCMLHKLSRYPVNVAFPFQLPFNPLNRFNFQLGICGNNNNTFCPYPLACISSQNNDEYHFAAPWAYSGARADAMRRVVEVVTDPSGRGVDPVSYRGGKERDRLKVSTTVAAYDESSGYVYLQITTSGADADSTQIFDVELLLWDDDEVVNVRCAARDRPKKGTWSLSYVDGVRFSRNEARDVAESIRVALGWEA